MQNQNIPEWVHHISEMNEDQKNLMEANMGFLLPINETLYFDLDRWKNSEQRRPNSYPDLPKKERAALLASVRDKGVDVEVVLDAGTYDVIDGHQRLDVLDECRRSGDAALFAGFVLKTFATDAERMDFEDRRAFGGRKLPRKLRWEKIRAMLRRHPEWSDSRIGAHLQITGDTVAKQARLLEDEEAFVRPDTLLDVNDRPMKMEGLKEKSKDHGEEGHETTPDWLSELVSAWWETHELRVVFAGEIAKLMKERDLHLADGRPTGNMAEKGVQKLVGPLLKGLHGQHVKDKYIFVKEFTSEKYVYQLLPRKYWNE